MPPQVQWGHDFGQGSMLICNSNMMMMMIFDDKDSDQTNVVSPVQPSGKSIAHTMSLHLSSV